VSTAGAPRPSLRRARGPGPAAARGGRGQHLRAQHPVRQLALDLHPVHPHLYPGGDPRQWGGAQGPGRRGERHAAAEGGGSLPVRPRRDPDGSLRFRRRRRGSGGVGDAGSLKQRGTGIEKALLLGQMLFFSHIEYSLVWARDRRLGIATDPKAANPAWFDAVFLRAKLDGKDVFLDPADPGLGFGQIPMAYEGTAALIPWDIPQGLTLPETPFDQNLRQAEVDLT